MALGSGKALGESLYKVKQDTSKATACEAHTIVVLCAMLLDKLDAYGDDISGDSAEYKEALKIVEAKSEDLLERAFGVQGVKTSTYIQDLTNKVATVIRKNYERMT